MEARVSVSSVQEEIEFWSASLAKFKCIGIKEGLQSMMWEGVFSPPEDPNKQSSLSASHLANFAAAREMAQEELSRVPSVDIGMALHLLKKQELRLLERDRTFILELQHLVCLVNGGAQHMLNDAILKVIQDCATKSATLEETSHAVLEISEDACYKDNTLAAKEDWQTAYDAVSALVRGQCPSSFDGLEDGTWLHQLAERCAHESCRSPFLGGCPESWDCVYF